MLVFHHSGQLCLECGSTEKNRLGRPSYPVFDHGRLCLTRLTTVLRSSIVMVSFFSRLVDQGKRLGSFVNHGDQPLIQLVTYLCVILETAVSRSLIFTEILCKALVVLVVKLATFVCHTVLLLGIRVSWLCPIATTIVSRFSGFH